MVRMGSLFISHEVKGHLEGVKKTPRKGGLTITIVINHLLNGMILQVGSLLLLGVATHQMLGRSSKNMNSQMVVKNGDESHGTIR